MDYRGKRVLIVGMARSGIAAARLLLRHEAVVAVNDSKKEADLGEDIRTLEGLPLEKHFGEPAGPLLAGRDVLVISPGIPIDTDFVQEAKKKGLYVTGELEVASQLSAGTLVAVTGTNGKTTTVSLLGEIFRNAGRKTHVVGNIGYPFSLAAMEARRDDMIVCEVSSFQMETADSFHPRVALITNLTEDHLNRHGTMEVYGAMKMRMFARQTAGDFAVFNADNPGLKGMSAQVHSRVLTFSRIREVKNGAFVRDGNVIWKLDGQEKVICSANEIRIPGPHNLENALGAVCCAGALGIPAPVIRHSLRTFQGVEHRIEYVRELDGITYYNDSKGTNVDSTLKAVDTMTVPTVIILGGYDKHTSFDPLSRRMLERQEIIREAVLIGDTAPQIEESLRRTGFEHIRHAGSMQEAVEVSRSLAGPGWNVLLSPACASFDMFKDYEERGRVFKEIVNRL